MADESKKRQSLRLPHWLHKPTRSNLIWMILSLFISLFIWVYIATNVSGNYSVSFSDIPIVLDTSNSTAADYGLSVISPESGSMSTNVTVTGSRTVYGGLNRDDIEAYVDFNSGVTNSVGRQKLTVRLRYKNGSTINNCSLSVNAVDVVMDKYTTREIPVSEVDCPNLTGSDSEVVISADNITCEPSTVTVYGPSESLSSIDHIRVNLKESEKLNQTKYFTNCTDYDLISTEGSIVSDSPFTLQNTQFTVKVAVKYVRTLPVTVGIKNVPSGFDVNQVLSRLRLNTDQEYDLPQFGENYLTIEIETEDPAKKDLLDQYEYWELDSIPLSSLSLGGTRIPIEVKMDEGFEDLSNLETVYVTMLETNLVAETRWISNSDIQPINGPAGYDFTIQSGRTRITIIGTAEEVAKVSASEIKAVVYLFNAAIPDEGTFQQAVTLTLPDTVSGVWVSPVPKVNITATPTADSTSD